ncbi:hypothetical protein T439DRAFT_356368 [Meredithblackwellia eburnea MCA 4105]
MPPQDPPQDLPRQSRVIGWLVRQGRRQFRGIGILLLLFVAVIDWASILYLQKHFKKALEAYPIPVITPFSPSHSLSTYARLFQIAKLVRAHLIISAFHIANCLRRCQILITHGFRGNTLAYGLTIPVQTLIITLAYWLFNYLVELVIQFLVRWATYFAGLIIGPLLRWSNYFAGLIAPLFPWLNYFAGLIFRPLFQGINYLTSWVCVVFKVLGGWISAWIRWTAHISSKLWVLKGMIENILWIWRLLQDLADIYRNFFDD